MANIQDFSVFQYARNFVSPLLRRLKFLALLNVFLTPLQSLRTRLTTVTYPELERRTRYNAQVARFERLLNTIFNTTGIYIDEAGNATHVYSYNEVELQPLYCYNEDEEMPIYTYYQSEYLPLHDFTVHIPQSLYNTQLARVRSIVKKYSLAGVTYSIVPF